MKRRTDAHRIAEMASEAAFGRPLVTNVWRALVVEATIAAHLPESEWTWCSADYAAYDFKHVDGARLEVKQSAARQSWATSNSEASRPDWDIRERQGFWEGTAWTAQRGRNADIYVFAYHPVVAEDADHRDPRQWQFYVVASAWLPKTKRIRLASLSRLSEPVDVDGLSAAIDRARLAVSRATDQPLTSLGA